MNMAYGRYASLSSLRVSVLIQSQSSSSSSYSSSLSSVSGANANRPYRELIISLADVYSNDPFSDDSFFSVQYSKYSLKIPALDLNTQNMGWKSGQNSIS